MNKMEKQKKGLAKLLERAKNTNELVLLLDDLLTPAEIGKVYERVQIVDCLDRKMSQRVALAKTGAAIATVSRGALLLRKNRLRLPQIINSVRKLAWWNTLFWCDRK
jgi:Trp operon repressor